MTRRKRVLCALLLVLVAIWVGLSPRFATGLYTQYLFQPDKGNGSQAELRSFDEVENHEVFFRGADNSTIHGWIYLNPGSRKILLVHPGNAGDIAGKLYLTKTLLETGASVFMYDPRGYGMSPGEPSPRTICEDGLAAYDYLTGVRGYKPEEIVLYGLSLGASVATYVASQRPAQGIILQSGFSSLETIGKEKVPLLRIYPSWLFPTPRLDNVELLKGNHPPLLILHGEKDSLIPISHAEELYREASEPKRLVRFPKSDHGSFHPDDVRDFVETVAEYLSRLP